MEKARIEPTNISLISGKRATGKTYFLKTIVVTHHAKICKVLIYDPLDQYAELGTRVQDLKEISSSLLSDKKKVIVFVPKDGEDTEEHFDQVAKFCMEKGNIKFVVDEFNEYTSPYYIPPYFRAFIRRGRNKGCGFEGITHRPSYISLNFLNMVDHWFIFAQDLEADLDRIAEYLYRAQIDFIPNYAQLKEREKKDAIKNFIATMPDRHFIYYSRDRMSGKAIAKFHKPIKGPITDTKIKH